MTQAIFLVAIIGAMLSASYVTLGYQPTYQIAYGALTLMAAMISLTFLWLWAKRATPLALGMSLSWAGASSVLGWWWAFNLLGGPSEMVESGALFLFLALYFAGAILHFTVIERSFGRPASILPLPALGALLLSALIRLLV